MRNGFRAIFLCASLLAMNAAFAQTVILFGVEGLNLGDRQNGMVQASSFNMGFVDSTATVQSTMPSGAVARAAVPGQRTAQDVVVTLPTGSATIMLSRAVMGATQFPRGVIQIVQANAKNAPIFQVQLYDVLVTSVVMGKSGNDSGPGSTEIRLRASRYEMFNNTQDPSGAMRPGAKAGIDVRAGRVY